MMILKMKDVITVKGNFVIFMQVFLFNFDISDFIMSLKNFILFFQDPPQFLHFFSYFVIFMQVFLFNFDISDFIMSLKSFILFFQDPPQFLHFFSYF